MIDLKEFVSCEFFPQKSPHCGHWRRSACNSAWLMAISIVLTNWSCVPAFASPADLQRGCEVPRFFDDFELPMGYELFEELVEPYPECYGTGQALYERSMQVSQSGDYSLLVWSNAVPANPPLNNHANVFKRLADCGTQGRFLYRVSFLVDPLTTDQIQTIEGSLQNTLPNGNGTTTKIGAIQYQGNPHLRPPRCRWAIWTGYPSPFWKVFLTEAFGESACLESDVWYSFDFDIEWDDSVAGRYGVFQLFRDGDLRLAIDLSSDSGGADNREFEPAFIVTMEDEALDNGCDGRGDFDLRVFFDDLEVTPLTQARGEVFIDGFESGDLSRWSSSTP